MKKILTISVSLLLISLISLFCLFNYNPNDKARFAKIQRGFTISGKSFLPTLIQPKCKSGLPLSPIKCMPSYPCNIAYSIAKNTYALNENINIYIFYGHDFYNDKGEFESYFDDNFSAIITISQIDTSLDQEYILSTYMIDNFQDFENDCEKSNYFRFYKFNNYVKYELNPNILLYQAGEINFRLSNGNNDPYWDGLFLSYKINKNKIAFY